MSIFVDGWETCGMSSREWIFYRYYEACVTGQHIEMSKIKQELSEEQNMQLEQDLSGFWKNLKEAR